MQKFFEVPRSYIMDEVTVPDTFSIIGSVVKTFDVEY